MHDAGWQEIRGGGLIFYLFLCYRETRELTILHPGNDLLRLSGYGGRGDLSRQLFTKPAILEIWLSSPEAAELA